MKEWQSETERREKKRKPPVNPWTGFSTRRGSIIEVQVFGGLQKTTRVQVVFCCYVLYPLAFSPEIQELYVMLYTSLRCHFQFCLLRVSSGQLIT